MSGNEYQQLAARTLLEKPPRQYTDNEIMIVWNCMGLAGESGETVDYIKKCIFHEHQIDYQKIKKEFGDILWYIAGVLTRLNITMEEVMMLNIEKLKERYPEGFKTADSINRKSSD